MESVAEMVPERVGKWCAEVREFHDTRATPVAAGDPRLPLLCSGRWTEQELLTQFTPEELAELYMTRVDKSDAPVWPFERPVWAVSSRLSFGTYPEVVISLRGPVFEQGEYRAYVEQAVTVFVADEWDETPTGTVIVHEPEVMTDDLSLDPQQAADLSTVLASAVDAYAKAVS